MSQWYIQHDFLRVEFAPAHGDQRTEAFQTWGPWDTRAQAASVAAQLGGRWRVLAADPLPGQHLCGACGRWFWSGDLDHPHTACYPTWG